MDIYSAAPDLDPVLCQELVHPTHELAPRVNLKQLRPLQGPPFVDARQGIGDLCSAFASQRLSLLVAAGDVNDRESIARGLPLHAIVGKKEQICLVDFIWYPDIKLRSRYVSWSRQVDLPDCLSLQPVLSHIFRNLGCRRQMFDGCDSLPIAPGAIIDPCQLCCQAGVHWHTVSIALLYAKYSTSPSNLQHVEATGSGSCPVVARRLVGPANTLRANLTMILSSSRQSPRDFCAVSTISAGQLQDLFDSI